MSLLLRNYNDLTFISNMDVDDLSDLVEKVLEDEDERMEKEVDDFLIHLWGYQLPVMEKPINFWEFRDLLVSSKKDKPSPPSEAKPTESNQDLIDRIEKIRVADQNKARLKAGDNK